MADKSFYTLFVELGRCVLIIDGVNKGKTACIVDICDQNRVLVDGPFAFTGVRRQLYNLKVLHLLPVVMKIKRGLRHKNLMKAYTEQKVAERLSNTRAIKVRDRRILRNNLTDYERHRVKVLKKRRKAIIVKEFRKLKGVKKEADLKLKKAAVAKRQAAKAASFAAAKKAELA